MILLLGCSTPNPELVAQRGALDAWAEGSSALESGDPATAAEAFQRAADGQPANVLLAAWQAKAHADAGDLHGAVDRLEEVLRAAPDFDGARYNRAAYLARLGELEDSAAELRRAHAGGQIRPRDALRDPDFIPHLDDPAFSFLPDEMLMVAVDAPTESVFWGSEATLRFRVVGADGAPVTLEAPAFSGPVALLGAVEDVVDSTDGPVRDLTYTLKVIGAGEVNTGPVVIRSGEWSTTLAERRFPTAAPPGKETPPDRTSLGLPIPSTLRKNLELPGARRVGSRIEVLSEGLDRVSLSPPPGGPALRFELRDRSRTTWVLQSYEAPGQSTVTVRGGGEVVFERAL